MAPHRHGVHDSSDPRRLATALALIVALMAAEVVVGLLAHSLALLSDAGHMVADAGALGLSMLALRLARRPAGGQLTFGLRRTETLSAQANGGTLLVLACLVVYEAVRRLVHPPHVTGWAVLVTALAGAAVNAAATWQVARAGRESMAVEGSYQHLLTDLYAFAATAAAGAVVVATGFARADSIASLLVAALMLRAAYTLLKQSGRVLLEAAPEGLDVDEIAATLAQHAEVASLHDLHVWEVGTGFPALSAHVLVAQGADCHRIRRELEAVLHDRFAIDHTTLQVEHAQPDLLRIRTSS
ncbi:MAG TPA: cation diffusion facilitator family transporter [Gaiellaceae bacterium]|nr:cation diffusion facilitator family transporter [Gaiellaceae bacterium]